MSDFHPEDGSTRYAAYKLASDSLAAMKREDAVTSVRDLGASTTAASVAVLVTKVRLEAVLANAIPASVPSLPDGIARARQALRASPIDDLEPHVADDILRALVGWHGAERVVGAIVAELRCGDLDTQAGLVQSFGRVDAAHVMPVAVGVLRAALQHPSLRVRGAALKAIEAWNTHEAREVLRDHLEPIDYLADTAKRLLARR